MMAEATGRSENHRHAFKQRTQHSMTWPHPWRYAQRCTGRRMAYRFFAENGGCLVGRQAEIALDMARAEEAAAERDWKYEWQYDDIGEDTKDICLDCEKGRCHKEHECLCAVLTDAAGHVLASLGGIWDPDNTYRRVVEAELAQEAIADEESAHRRLVAAWGSTAHGIGPKGGR